MLGMTTVENGFHLFSSNHQPEIVSPNTRGDVSSNCVICVSCSHY